MTVLTYGGYSHDEYSVTISINNRGLENPTGYVYGYVTTLSVTGVIQGEDLAGVLTKQQLLEEAYTIQNQDILWVSGNSTIIQINSAATQYGVRVAAPPTFSQGAAAGELVNRRRYTLTLEAAYLYDIAALGTVDNPYVVDYESNLSFTGTGGPAFGHLPTLTGRFQKQILTETSLVTAQQSGKRVALNFTPIPDPPFEHLVDYEKQDRRVIRYGTPRRINNTAVEYPVFWDYTFERNRPFPAAATT